MFKKKKLKKIKAGSDKFRCFTNTELHQNVETNVKPRRIEASSPQSQKEQCLGGVTSEK